MKKIVLTLLAAIAVTCIWAQQPLCPVKEGVSLLYVMKDAKGKVKNYSRQTVTLVEGSGNNLTITYLSEALDAKKKPLANAPVISYTTRVENGAVVIDPKSILNSISTAFPTDGAAEGTPMILPANMKAGDKLPDCEMKMQITVFYINASYTNGVCEGEEQITTAAGTFLCKKTKYDFKSSAGIIKSNGVIHTWYAPGVGVVKQEMFNNKGKLNTYQELVELSK